MGIKQWCWSAVLLFIVPFAMGCGATLLQAEFSDARPGDLPPRSLPGPPAGDALIFTPGPGSAVSIADGGDSSPALSVRYASGSLYPYVIFRAIEARPFNNGYLVKWEGYPLLGPDAAVHVNVMSGHAYPGVELTLRNGQFFLRTGENEEMLGDYKHSQKHTVLIPIDLNTRTYTLTIFREGARNLQVTSRRLLSNDFPDSPMLELAINFSGSFAGGGGVYMIDNVIIKEGQQED